MYRLMYMNSSSVVEEFSFPSKALCIWKRNQLINQGSHKMGTFKIIKL